MQTDKFKVFFNETEVTDLVAKVTMNENIGGFIQGSIDIIDGTNVFTSMFSKANTLPIVMIEFDYLGARCTNSFTVNGVKDRDILSSFTEFTCMIITPEQSAIRLAKLNAVYEGTSGDIVGKIFTEATGVTAKLSVTPNPVSKGKYVVPNIAAVFAINNVVKTAIDEYQSGYYFYQTVWSSGGLEMTSLRAMNEKFTVVPGSRGKQGSGQTGKYWCIESSAASACDLEEGNLANIGKCSNIKGVAYKTNYLERLAMGLHGNQSVENSLETTTINAHEATQITADELYTYKISSKLYDGISAEESFIGVEKVNMGAMHTFYWSDISMSTDAQRFVWIGDGTMTGPARITTRESSPNYGKPILGKTNKKSARYDPDVDGQLAKWIHQLNFKGGDGVGHQTKYEIFHRNQALKNIAILEGERNRISNGVKVRGDISNTSQSLFENMNSPTMIQMNNQKVRVEQSIVHADGVVAIPGISCGRSIKVKMQVRDKARDAAAGIHIIKQVTHIFERQDNNKYDYYQNFELMREKG